MQNEKDTVLYSLFSNIKQLRTSNEVDIVKQWLAARKEDKELADNLIFYIRDIRNGGAGERRVGRILLKTLAKVDPHKVVRNFQKIVDTGRWDDLFTLEDTPVEEEMWNFIYAQFRKDMCNWKISQDISLLAKWMPSINTSSKEKRRLAKKFCNKFNYTPKTYRKMLSALRDRLNVFEKRAASNQWDLIDYSSLSKNIIHTHYKALSKRTDIEPVSKIISELKCNAALKNIDIALKDTTGQFRSLNNIFSDINEKWNDLDKKEIQTKEIKVPITYNEMKNLLSNFQWN